MILALRRSDSLFQINRLLPRALKVTVGMGVLWSVCLLAAPCHIHLSGEGSEGGFWLNEQRKWEWTARQYEFMVRYASPPEELESLTISELRARIAQTHREVARLKAAIEEYDDLVEREAMAVDGFLETLEARRAKGEIIQMAQAALEQISFEKRHPVNEIRWAREKAEEVTHFLEQAIEACGRVINRIEQREKKASSIRLPLDDTIAHASQMTPSQITFEILGKLSQAGYTGEDVHFYLGHPLREDLVRLYGTDRYGLSANEARILYRPWDGVDRLRQGGLLIEDGFFTHRVDEVSQDFIASKFQHGRRLIVIYDKRYLSQRNGFTFFKDPTRKHRQKAVVGVLRARP